MPSNSSSADASSLTEKYGGPYTLLLGAILAVALLRWFTTSKQDSREPPILHPKIPLIGHLLGIAQLQADYLQKLCTKIQKPIFTLKIFSANVYIITTPELVQAVYRNPKTLSFDPISNAASKRIFQMTERQVEILRNSAPGIDDSEEFPVAKATYKMMHATIQPGPSLFEMNARALNRFSSFLDDIGKEGKSVNLFEWLKHHVTIATAEALYGPENPISEDVSMIQKLSAFETSIGLLFLDVLPSITCRAGHRARYAFTAAFRRYYNAQHNLAASAFIQGRFSTLSAGGYTTDDIASFDVGILMGATMNSNPGLFWLISYIFDDLSHLSSIRAEVESITTLTSSPNGTKEATIDVGLLNSKCPLLVSTWQETLRVKAATISNRVVLEDTLLNSTYLLKKGGVIQMPIKPMQTSHSTWGDDSSTFSATRFMPSSTDTLGKEDRKRRKQAYAPFGGGTVLCPGRYFAMMEIVGVAATLAVGFEMEGMRVLGTKMQVLSAQILHPDGDLPVKIRRREGWEGVKFMYEGVVKDGDEVENLAFD